MTDVAEAEREARVVAHPASPYVGLVPFQEEDAQFFFGRSHESAIVAANLRSRRLTLLYGPSGVGKSSLVQAGLLVVLRREARQATARSRFAVCVFNSWLGDPARGLEQAAHTALLELAGDEPLPPPGATLTESLRAWTEKAGTLFVVLDQFEEYFQYHPDEGGERLTGFAAELVRIVNDQSLRVRVLLSIREDAWSKLDRFKGHIPSLFSNYLHVEHLDLDAAREAVEGPIDAWNESLPAGAEEYSIEPELVETVLEQVARSDLNFTAGRDTRAVPDETAGVPSNTVRAPFLQLVLERLWLDTAEHGAHTLTLARLRALNGVRGIVENHLDSALGRLTRSEQDVASDCFGRLVSSTKTKYAVPAADLAESSKPRRSTEEVTAVLDKLCSGEGGRILRTVAPAQDGGSASYELFHDVLAEPILAWRRGHEAERNQRAIRRRVIRVGSILFTLVAVFAVLGVWAWIQRNEARHRARVANSVILASAAEGLVDSRLDESLILALTANGIDATAPARSAMTDALETAHKSGLDAILRSRSVARVYSVAFSRDGTLASGGEDGTVRLWDLTTRKPLGGPLRGSSRGPVLSVAFSPDGKTLASGGQDGTVRLWELASGKPLGKPLTGSSSSDSILSVAFSRDGKTLASGGVDGSVRLWDVATRDRLGRPLPTGSLSGSVQSIAFSRDGKALASGGDDGTVRLWDLTTRKPLARPLRGSSRGAVHSVAFSRDGKTLASGGEDGTVRLWDLETRKPLGTPLRGSSTGSVLTVALSRDGKTLASGGEDGTVRLWDLTTRQKLGILTGSSSGSVYSAAFSRDGTTLASGGDDGTVRLWDLTTRVPLGKPLTGNISASVNSVAFSPDGKTLASGGEDRTVRLWDLATRQKLGILTSSSSASVFSVAFSPDGQTLASGYDNGTVRLWDLTTRKPLGRPLRGSNHGSVFSVAFSSDGKTLATGGVDGTVRLWDLATRKPLGKPLTGNSSATVHSVAFSPDGQTLASGNDNGTVRLWDLTTRKPLGRPLRGSTHGSVFSVAFSSDGKTLASGGVDGTVRLWHPATQQTLGVLIGRGSVYSVAFSPDGKTLASGSDDATVRLWDVATRKLLGSPLTGNSSGSVDSVAFSPDGETLAGGEGDGTVGKVLLWEGILWTDYADLQHQVCRLVSGNLARDEWQDVAPPGIGYRASCPD